MQSAKKKGSIGVSQLTKRALMELQVKPHVISLPSNFDFDELEDTLREAAQKAVHATLNALVRHIEKLWLATEAAKGYQSKGWLTRIVSTSLGELSIRRGKFYTPSTKETVIAFDALTNLRRHTSRVQEMAVRLASELSFSPMGNSEQQMQACISSLL